MPRPPQPFGLDHLAELIRCYEGEVAGAAYFTALAAAHEGPARSVLSRFADVERTTAAALLPLVQRHGLVVADADELRRRGEANAAVDSALGWDALVAEMCEHYPSYVPEFERLSAIAPLDDKAAMQVLVDHEVALVASVERIRDGRADALAPVDEFIAAATSPR
ncbi:MAG: hypothetical protein RL238_256 [Actinomycetota bacterium]|jgi:hypothetical protein